MIELLVVIAIIALLLSIVMPSLKLVREKAKTLVCTSDLRQLGIGFRMYIDKYEGKMPVIYDASLGPPEWLQWTPPWYVLVGEMVGWNSDGTSGGVDVATKNIIHCPAAERRVLLSDDTYTELSLATATYTTSMYNRNTRFDEIPSPSDYIFLSDGYPSYFVFNPHTVFPELIWWSERIVHRHEQKSANHLYFDQHIERITEEELYEDVNIEAFWPVSEPPNRPL